MNLATLKKICAAYHNKTVAELTDEKTNVDMFLVAVNNARKWAEREHNFESAWCKGTLAVAVGTGGALSAVTIVPTLIFQGIKEIISVAQLQAGQYVPIILRRPNRRDALRGIPRVPTDAQLTAPDCESYLIIRGDTIYKFPDPSTGSAVTIYLEAYGWLLDYTDAMLDKDAAEPDFIVIHGFEFLQWAVILELNYVFQTFVFRQEGNPGAPEKKLAAAWESLVDWDSYRVAPHITDDR